MLGQWPICCNWPTKTNMDYVGSNADLSNKSKIQKTKTSRSWLQSDPEVKRKKRVATYKVFSMEGKVKQSVRSSCRWLKAKYVEVRYRWWWWETTTLLEQVETNLNIIIIIVNNVQHLNGTEATAVGRETIWGKMWIDLLCHTSNWGMSGKRYVSTCTHIWVVMGHFNLQFGSQKLMQE